MNEIITQLIAASINPMMIPSFDCFDMSNRYQGYFEIVLNDMTRIRVEVSIVPENVTQFKQP